MKKNVVYLVLSILFSLSAAYADVLIVANKDVPENTLNQQEIREIFLGKRVQWSDNSRIRFATLAIPEIHSMFLEQYVKMSEADWKIFWKRMVFTGRGLPPEIMAAESEMIDFVKKTKGAVGYVSSEGMAKNPEKDAVKIIGVK